MTAKQYLKQIEVLDKRVKNMLIYYEQCTLDIASLRSPRLDADRVQSSESGAGFTVAIEKLVDAQAKTNKVIDDYIDLKDMIIGQINQMQEPYASILFKRYVEYKNFMVVANEMNYSYDRILTLHGIALQRFSIQFGCQ